ncbi:sensor histidine kinase [Planotetraspora sp. A-T 1434]|uniref:sensor histidine kinase n=1 Tax=Planotetraspora sp. A-T 1434 TaxID=2979219 RepID=UPI0021BFDEE7|nr:sensor histidine kinase [Planotetraspora sp. A-T 1434]MCT9934724.1 sensor histidine kinase [Planotetraspora sp. A-T 1434]
MNRRTAVAVRRGLALFLLALLGQVVALVALVGILLTFLFGMIFLFPPAVRLARAMAGLNRRVVREWCGVDVEEPYLPAPPPPVPQRDGWYREGRSLYKTPRIPAFNQRLSWLMKDSATWHDLAFLVPGMWAGGLIAGAPLLLVVLGVAQLVGGTALGLVWVALAVASAPWYAPWALRSYGQIARALLGPTEKARLARRVSTLARARTEVVDSQAAELRRIERDLHDGAQARLVAVGMTIGAAEQLMESDPAAAKALLAKARDASSDALQEIRRLVRGIHPPVLAERGLGDAVRAMALDSPLRTHVTVDLAARPDPPLESAAYFAVSELLTNAVRHGGATEAWIDLSHQGTALRIMVSDDGQGGADPSRGTGLQGIERRIAAFDGVLALSSPAGGPTTVTIELPRAFEVRLPPIPKWRAITMALCWALCWIPLIPQGFVTMGFKLAGASEKAWFLALYLPEPWQWPVIVGMIALGATMLTVASVLTAQHREEGASCE